MENSELNAQEGCIFCGVVAGTTPAEIVYDGGDTLFFHDISPKTQVHILGIPKKHIASVGVMTEADRLLMGKLLQDISAVANKLGIDKDGYRIINNVGDNAGQVVKHIHFHVMGGERLGPMKC